MACYCPGLGPKRMGHARRYIGTLTSDVPLSGALFAVRLLGRWAVAPALSERRRMYTDDGLSVSYRDAETHASRSPAPCSLLGC